MRILVLTTPDRHNGVYYFDRGLTNGLSRCNDVTLVKPQMSKLKSDELAWLHPDLVLLRWHKSLLRSTDLDGLRKLKKAGATIGGWVSPFFPRALQVTSEQRELHSDETLRQAAELLHFGLTWYGEEGVEAFFSPWRTKFNLPIFRMDPAADTNFYVQTPATKKIYDLCYIGGNVWNKLHAHHWLEKPLRLHPHVVCGKGWEDKGFNVADIEPKNERKIYAQTKVCPNLHIDACWKIRGMAVNQRLFQIPACGAFQIVDNHPRIGEFFDPGDVVVAQSAEDFAEKIEYYLSHPRSRLRMVERAYRRVMSSHTFTQRAQTLRAFVKDLRS
ncbi:MAG: glycosyltransferase [Candidatus Eisenbacteria bacterium]|nr:glycosyltransferase [Candidatus Eisenbacteria bacterium]